MRTRFLPVTLILLLAIPAYAQPGDEPIFLRSRGYGWIIAASDEGVVIYQETVTSLLPWTVGFTEDDVLFLAQDADQDGNLDVDAGGDLLFFPTASFREEEDSVVLEVHDGTVIVFDPIDELPQRQIDGPTDDPEASFQVFWEVLEENSAYFALTGFDWRAAYEVYRPQVTAGTSDEELFEILAAMAAPLHDSHLSLVAADLGRGFEGRPASPSSWMVERAAEAVTVIVSYLDEGTAGVTANNRFLYGTIDGSIGYLGIAGFSGYAEIPDPLADQAVFEAALDEVLTDFADLDSLIIDIRANPGGSDNLPLALAGRFTDRVRLGFSKQARIGGYDEFAEPTEVFFGPRGVQFSDRPVILLTSNFSVSGADVQAMLLKGLPNVLLVGETTYGAFSNAHPAVLPNGWRFRISNERYLSPENPPRDYELIGIVPDVPVAGSEEALDQGQDNILEEAIDLLTDGNACQPGQTRLCLQNDRFAVEVAWENFQGDSGTGRAVPLTADTGSFWFFDASNLELFIKVLDGRGINDHFWVFYGALSNVEFTLTITDTETDLVKTYHNSAGSFASVGDVEALPE